MDWSIHMNLEKFNWSHFIQKSQHQEVEKLARITHIYPDQYQGVSEQGPLQLYLSGKFRYEHQNRNDYPVVGDYVEIGEFFDDGQGQAGIIEKVLERQSKLARKQSGKSSNEQVLAANVDSCFILTSLNQNFKLNRIQRYVFLASQGNVRPVIVLSKKDLIENLEDYLAKVKNYFADIPVLAISIFDKESISELSNFLKAGETGVFIGSSGVGKSSVINLLLGEAKQKVIEIRSDDAKGRHATTSSSLFITSNDSILIDTAGLREVGVTGEELGENSPFTYIEELAANCGYTNCTHQNEPHCAIIEALETGELDRESLNNYFNLQRQAEHTKRKSSKKESANAKKRWKGISKMARELKKNPKF